MCKDCNNDDFLDDCETLLERIDELPERATEFAESVKDKVTGMRDWSSKNKHVTDAMWKSLEAISGGVEKWFKD